MKLVSANIKSNPLMVQPHVIHDMDVVRKTGGIILWQEIEPKRYKQALRDTLDGGWVHTHTDTENPISYRSELWEYVPELSGKAITHLGRKHVSPARWVVWTGLRRKHTNQKPVIFMNTHMISGAFSNHYPLTKKWRRTKWDLHFKHQQTLVNDFVSAGHTVIGGGDMNRGAMPKYNTKQRWLAQGGIDHLFCVEATEGTHVRLIETNQIRGVYTDHNPRVAHLSFYMPPAPKVDVR